MLAKTGALSITLLTASLLLGFASNSTAATDDFRSTDGGPAIDAQKEKVVIQVSDKDPSKWNLSLNNARNVQAALGGADKVDVEIVVYGPGIGMLEMDSVVGGRVDDALSDGIDIVACQNTMSATGLTEADMLPDIGYVPAGVIEIMEKQKQGYAYIRP
ncbi:MAG: DsrE family protein [Thiogranum sp.]|nr:DsrE family protein [Thiogranum sp.]